MSCGTARTALLTCFATSSFMSFLIWMENATRKSKRSEEEPAVLAAAPR